MTSTGSDAPRARGSYAKGIARRQEILDRAIEVFAERGARRTSLRAIAEEVGVTHAALTHYFGSLDELLVAVYRESERRGDENPVAPPDTTPGESMRIAAQENRAVPGMVQLYSTLVASALEDDRPAAQEFAASRFARLRAEMAERVRELQDAGRLRGDVEPELAAALVIAASDGLQTQWLLDPTVDHEAALAMLDRLLAPPAD
ncbi:AcrR family transcriptional regulator [Microbacterium terrae]|uniref:HTH-type transcriptional regulator BetI n=1 Tax=Microbacterium terrae TaxID=69369 RepID=A0A0M2HE92_9MICO|nr:TetR/AcrR family transcriptional regulator [Microbacterium terrae]KJL43014.1 HTH-type transcriptional regulator BetI [Microbacterium terrae]MBP1079338.1 AcrR family transcriptional regulator [Microbacterium terrae]GLJ98738.1 transcriptional regulator [Microbacterium terrae]